MALKTVAREVCSLACLTGSVVVYEALAHGGVNTNIVQTPLVNAVTKRNAHDTAFFRVVYGEILVRSLFVRAIMQLAAELGNLPHRVKAETRHAVFPHYAPFAFHHAVP